MEEEEDFTLDGDGVDIGLSVRQPLTSSFAARGRTASRSPLVNARLLDSRAQSLRQARLGPMAAQAGAEYNQQAGDLQSMLGMIDADRDSSIEALREAYKDTVPSDSEKWLGVAAALLSPTETGKTTESIAKALGVFGQYAGEKRKARREEALGLVGLSSKYGLQKGSLAARLLAQQAAAERASRPKYQYDEYEQKWVQVPGTGGLPDLPQPGDEGGEVVEVAQPPSRKLPDGRTAYWVNGKWYDNPEGR